MSTNLYDQLLDQLGMSIVDGTLPAGTRLLLSDIEEHYDVSRTVARDAIKVLEALGLTVTKRRAGIVVQSAESWQVLDPMVIAWRLRGMQRDRQLASLVDVREAIEPRAAALAARSASGEQSRRMVELAAIMTELGQRGLGRSEAYLDADLEYHRLLLESSGNEMLAAMSGMVEAVLRGRSQTGLTPARPDDRALAYHEAIAAAVRYGESDLAEQASRDLFGVIRAEVLDEHGNVT